MRQLDSQTSLKDNYDFGQQHFAACSSLYDVRCDRLMNIKYNPHNNVLGTNVGGITYLNNKNNDNNVYIMKQPMDNNGVNYLLRSNPIYTRLTKLEEEAMLQNEVVRLRKKYNLLSHLFNQNKQSKSSSPSEVINKEKLTSTELYELEINADQISSDLLQTLNSGNTDEVNEAIYSIISKLLQEQIDNGEISNIDSLIAETIFVDENGEVISQPLDIDQNTFEKIKQETEKKQEKEKNKEKTTNDESLSSSKSKLKNRK